MCSVCCLVFVVVRCYVWSLCVVDCLLFVVSGMLVVVCCVSFSCLVGV